jgi:hypothetical protein
MVRCSMESNGGLTCRPVLPIAPRELSSDGRGHPSPSINTPDLTGTSPPPEPLLIAPNTAPFPPPASRDPSLTRGRAASAASTRNASPRGVASSSQTRPKQSLDVERKPSVSYGHHRNTSIVHGVQHSRNTSNLSNSTSVSPLSPQKILPTNGSTGDHAAAAASHPLKKSPSMSTLHMGNGMSGLPPARSFETTSTGLRRPERMHSGRVKRPNEHHRTQSRQQAQQQEPKTVGEYAPSIHLVYRRGGREDRKMYGASRRGGATFGGCLWSGCRSELRSIDIIPWPHQPTQAEVRYRFGHFVAQKEKRPGKADTNGTGNGTKFYDHDAETHKPP